MSKNKCKSSFQDEWLSNELYKTWIKRTEGKHKSYCKVCNESFTVSGPSLKPLGVQAK